MAEATKAVAQGGAQAEKKLSEKTRRSVWWRSQFLQGSMNYERMQNMGWCFGIMPALRELYDEGSEGMKQALQRHLEFFNTQPFLASPIFGVTMTLEEKKASGANVDDAAINGVKIGMMGPLAGVGDPVFWGTLRPVLGAFGASLALSGSIGGAVIFFVAWNVIRLAFMWYTQELGYKQGENLTKDLSGGFMRKVTLGASILGMFIMGVLIPRWTSMPMTKVIFAKDVVVGQAADNYPAAASLINGLMSGSGLDANGITEGIRNIMSLGSTDTLGLAADGTLSVLRTTTLQSVLDQLLPGLLPLGLTFLCLFLLRKKVSPIAIIFGLFAVGILGAFVGIF